jgi:hypothetical protein
MAKFNIFRIFYGYPFAAAKNIDRFDIVKQRGALAHGKVAIGVFPVYNAGSEFFCLVRIPDRIKITLKNIPQIIVVYPTGAARVHLAVTMYFYGTKCLTAGKLFTVHTVVLHRLSA